jgi:catechol 2,3-dioxygenase-like lactoylglutathione lyase family enzyme
MVRTYGLTHLALAVRDLDRTLRFYREVFGALPQYRADGCVDVTTPGCHDVITFDARAPMPGETGGIAHFGFRLLSPEDIDPAAREVERAGGSVLSRGEFAPGVPFLYAADPDGYVIEIWFE